MHYTNPMGSVYKKDPILGRWVEIPEAYLVAQNELFQADSLSNFGFCHNLNKICPTIALGEYNSISVLGPIKDVEASLYVMDKLIENSAYVPGHILISYLDKSTVLEQAERLAPCPFDQPAKKRKTDDNYQMVKRVIEVQKCIEDETYAYEQISLLGLEQYLSGLGLTIVNKHIVLQNEEKRLREYVKKYPMTIYCKTNRYNRPPIDIARIDKTSIEMEKYMDNSSLYNAFYRNSPSLSEILWKMKGPACTIDLPMAIIESVFSKHRKARKATIKALIDDYAKDIGIKQNINSFYLEVFKHNSTIKYEGLLLGISFEGEYARLCKERAIMLSDTEEGEIK